MGVNSFIFRFLSNWLEVSWFMFSVFIICSCICVACVASGVCWIRCCVVLTWLPWLPWLFCFLFPERQLQYIISRRNTFLPRIQNVGDTIYSTKEGKFWFWAQFWDVQSCNGFTFKFLSFCCCCILPVTQNNNHNTQAGKKCQGTTNTSIHSQIYKDRMIKN